MLLWVQKSRDLWKLGSGKLISISPNTIKRVQFPNKVEEDFVKAAGCRVMNWFGLPNLDRYGLLFEVCVYIARTWIKYGLGRRSYMWL